MDCQAHVKRPMNCFMVWSREKRYQILKDNPGINNAEVSKALGAAWRKLSNEEKEPYIEEARRLTEQHKMKNPGYKYQPRRRKPKRRRQLGKNPRTSFILPGSKIHKPSEETERFTPCKLSLNLHETRCGEFGERPSLFLPSSPHLRCYAPIFQPGLNGFCSCPYFYPAAHFYQPPRARIAGEDGNINDQDRSVYQAAFSEPLVRAQEKPQPDREVPFPYNYRNQLLKPGDIN